MTKKHSGFSLPSPLLAVLIFGALLFYFYHYDRATLDRFFTPENRPGTEELGLGTGFFVTGQHVITNHHVVEGCKTFTVTEPKNLKTTLTYLASDPYNDLAILVSQNPPKNVAVLRANMDEIHAGDRATIIGYPSGEYAFKKATILNPDERVERVPPEVKQPFTERKIILTDSVRKGNSGGPLLDSLGNVIGVIEGYREIEETTYKEENGQKTILSTAQINNGSAVHLLRLRAFLDYYHIPYFLSLRDAGYLPDSNMEDYANQFTVQIVCVK
jgi:serine protease Do